MKGQAVAGDQSLYDDIKKECGAEITDAMSIVDQSLNMFKISELAFSFNGGKDCTVLFHLLRAALANRRLTDSSYCPDNLLTIYFQRHDDEFPELIEFMNYITKKFGFTLRPYRGQFKAGLWSVSDQHPELKAVFMGVRRTDPNCSNLTSFERCDSGWPDIIRINPILDLKYSDIWKFLKMFDLEYCSLYDNGFTSLGRMSATIPNPLLKRPDCPNKYSPAFMLKDADAERAGRS